MGAYYTREDITGYISRNTIIPFLLEGTRRGCPVAFEGEGSVWQLLKADPDRYIYPAVRKGAELDLPPEIEVGVADVARRIGWNRPAGPEYANPTEIWRVVVARRQRYAELKGKMAAGEFRSVDDLITHNLDMEQFAQDVVENADESELKALWPALQKVTVLDPTVGSGAFLFAALGILDRLYEACLDRMEALVGDLERSGERYRPERMAPFKKALEEMAEHSNRRYSVLKSIVVNNLYGVDIMEEAVEICKLRLFLKLVAQLEPGDKVEPLPDIDVNVRAGNTLVGYATYSDVERAVTSKFDFEGILAKIKQKVQDVDGLMRQFRLQQTELGGDITPEDKSALRVKLNELEDELNRYLAREYNVDPNGAIYDRWLKSNKPFHWFVEFHRIMESGGFDVVIGNPPYLELREVDYTLQGYRTGGSAAIHAMCVERGLFLLNGRGTISMIVPLALVSTQRMETAQDLLEECRSVWYRARR